MNYLKDDIPDIIAGVHLWRATIEETATALDHQVRVNLPDFDVNLLWGPCKWMPRIQTPPSGITTLMPKKGDYALVILDNVHEAWIVVWWPAAYGGILAYN